MSIVVINNLTFSYDGSYEEIFEDVNFNFDSDWKIGLIGRNGRGKTTLLKLILGEEEYKGEIISAVAFSLFPFDVPDESQTSVEIIEELNPTYEFWELCRELNLMNVPEELLFRPFDTLSHGERTKIQLAMLFIKKDNYLLLDEPTNHLDAEGKDTIKEYLSKKKSFILVSHDRTLLDAVTDHTISLNRSSIEVVAGSFSQWQENREKQDNFEFSENEKLRREIKKLQTAASRTANWSDKVESTKTGAGPVDRGFIGHKSAKMMKRSKSIESRQEDAIVKKSKLLNDTESVGSLKISTLKYHSTYLVRVNDLAIAYDDKQVVDDINFEIMQGQRLHLKGGNGSGKSSILKLIAGESVSHIHHTGIVRIGSGVRISYLPQSTSYLRGSMQTFAKEAGINFTLFLTILINLGLSRNHFEHDISELSEGQKKKILIAKSLSEEAHLYIWDEPLNYIDILSRIQIEDLILRFEPTMIFVEHDEVFSTKISNSEPIVLGGVNS